MLFIWGSVLPESYMCSYCLANVNACNDQLDCDWLSNSTWVMGVSVAIVTKIPKNPWNAQGVYLVKNADTFDVSVSYVQLHSQSYSSIAISRKYLDFYAQTHRICIWEIVTLILYADWWTWDISRVQPAIKGCRLCTRASGIIFAAAFTWSRFDREKKYDWPGCHWWQSDSSTWGRKCLRTAWSTVQFTGLRGCISQTSLAKRLWATQKLHPSKLFALFCTWVVAHIYFGFPVWIFFELLGDAVQFLLSSLCFELNTQCQPIINSVVVLLFGSLSLLCCLRILPCLLRILSGEVLHTVSKCFCCGVPITHLQHRNKHEYNIDSLLNIQFATVLLQHYITYLQQHINNTNTMLGKYDYNIDTIT